METISKMNDLPKRKHIRLREYDYSQNNFYFVTICTHDKKHLFGMGEHLTNYGICAKDCLNKIHSVFPCVRLDKFVVMPNHIHAILVIEHDTATDKIEAASMYACPTLGTVIGNYKAAVSRQIHQIVPNQTVWQSRFYDHVIRNQRDYEAIWQYIDENPVKWETDEYF